jgi:hypothetical protein
MAAVASGIVVATETNTKLYSRNKLFFIRLMQVFDVMNSQFDTHLFKTHIYWNVSSTSLVTWLFWVSDMLHDLNIFPYILLTSFRLII